MSNLQSLTPKQLGKKLESAESVCSKACDAVYALGQSNEKGSEICARLGEGHPAVKAWREAIACVADIRDECERRWGKDRPASGWASFCSRQKCTRRIA